MTTKRAQNYFVVCLCIPRNNSTGVDLVIFAIFADISGPLLASSFPKSCYSRYSTCDICNVFKADRLQMIVVAKKYICVATVHQQDF